MSNVRNIIAQEILDSRGNPTAMVNVTLNNGITKSSPRPACRVAHPRASGILALFSAGLLQLLVFAKAASGAASNQRVAGL